MRVNASMKKIKVKIFYTEREDDWQKMNSAGNSVLASILQTHGNRDSKLLKV